MLPVKAMATSLRPLSTALSSGLVGTAPHVAGLGLVIQFRIIVLMLYVSHTLKFYRSVPLP